MNTFKQHIISFSNIWGCLETEKARKLEKELKRHKFLQKLKKNIGGILPVNRRHQSP